MNKCIITGRLTKAPELKYTANNKAVCEFTIASNRPVVREGQKEADFVNCQAWNKTAENLAKYQDKGSLIAVYGSYTTDSYEKDGQMRYKNYILVNEIEFLGSAKQSGPVIEEVKPSEEVIQARISDDIFRDFGDTIDDDGIAF